MKYFCEACERLVPPASVRMEDGLLVVKCSRCKVEMRGAPETDESRAPRPAAVAAAKESEPESVISLALDDAEPDPIEYEPTRRMVVPAELLAAIQAEAEESRRKAKDNDKGKDKDKGPKDKKAPMPVLTPALESKPQRAPEPVKVHERVRTPAPMRAAEPVKTPAPAPSREKSPDKSSRQSAPEPAAGANLTVLKLSEVKARTTSSESVPAPPRSEPEPAPAPAPEPERSPGPNLRVVRDSGQEPAVPPAAAASGPEDPFMPPSGFCPKCIGTRKEGAAVCPHCGLDFSRFKPDELRPSPTVASTWLGVVELWETRSAHDKVLALASERGELPALGRLYRIRLARHPDDPIAHRGREEVVRLASAGSLLMPTPPPDKRTKIRVAVLGAVFFLLLVVAVSIGVKVRQMMAGGSP
ncbi:zinc ribbon domain-containing protein [Melittangium boletus]|uniref:Uncharacterized protein n=1 Tax=Melittangium boletus DSM 14713 TaxID=1294270 RepID=A0A250IDJ7_9BACT|nr:zinc ribbon domain-containing protein [Melittangium boletus]ATB29036.1 hypothetical protein MEBOL_002485 [Melittangium boletus DSM 14713]